ncbi:MAG TPA: holo-ACP synthase [Desulfobacteraceae bacterium]|nr:holo-ACP synthase [Desulfobacteraceae bacterium]
MIYGIGIDLVRISRMDRVIKRWGERFIGRVFTIAEVEECESRPKPAAAFALRFAAKEAFSKALGTGMRQGVAWRDIETISLPGGRPDLRVHGKAGRLCVELGISAAHLSLSDEGAYGSAMVVLESAGSGSR